MASIQEIYRSSYRRKHIDKESEKTLIANKHQGQKRRLAPTKPHIYQAPKTAASPGITCAGGNTGDCGLPVIWFDYELGEKNHRSGFVCDAHKVSNRVEKLAQPT